MGGADRKSLALPVERDVLIGLDPSRALTPADHRVAGLVTVLDDADLILGRTRSDAAIPEATPDGDGAAMAWPLLRDVIITLDERALPTMRA